MKLKVYSHGNKILRQEGEWIEPGHKGLQELIDNMFETMYDASGIGLAAQQIGQPLKLFILDLTDIGYDSIDGFKKVFINSEIIEQSDGTSEHDEGCLSFPGLNLKIERPKRVKLYYQDENFNEYEEWFDGMSSTAVQHEHDHTEGIVFTNHVQPIRKRLIQSKLNDISKGKIDTFYRMKFPGK